MPLTETPYRVRVRLLQTTECYSEPMLETERVAMKMRHYPIA